MPNFGFELTVLIFFQKLALSSQQFFCQGNWLKLRRAKETRLMKNNKIISLFFDDLFLPFGCIQTETRQIVIPVCIRLLHHVVFFYCHHVVRPQTDYFYSY